MLINSLNSCPTIISNNHFQLIIDDEKLFLLQDQSTPINRGLHMSDKRPTPSQFKFKTTHKFEAKVLVCIAISEKDISKPNRNKLLVKQRYLNRCILGRLIPLIKSNDNKEKVLTSLRVIIVTMFDSISMKTTYKEFHRQTRPIETLCSILKNMGDDQAKTI